MALSRRRVEYRGETLELPLPDGPGKALKLTIAPVQEQIPVFLAVIGLNNTTLAAEIADGWTDAVLPRARGRVPAAARGGFRARGDGKGFEDFEIAPTVNVMISDDARPRARDAAVRGAVRRRHGVAREELLQRARCGATGPRTPRNVQDLYLEGKRDEAMAALPDELLDTVSLCGPPDAVRERLGCSATRRVGTLMVSPMAWTYDDRIAQLRLVAELAV